MFLKQFSEPSTAVNNFLVKKKREMSENPILYSNIHSAGCRAVLMTGAELGVEFDIQDIDLLSFAHKKAAYVQVRLVFLSKITCLY